jgi:hypothetical protein
MNLVCAKIDRGEGIPFDVAMAQQLDERLLQRCN